MKWNSSGTSLLFLSSTDHDKTGKSYYGETNLYLMTPALQYEARVTLAKEGGIGDFAWNPANGGKEFAVSYGFMPAKTTLFDMRLNVLHEFGSLPRNYVSFNPQGRLLCIAGFGNLAGQVDIWDRSTLRKVANFQASNCTECVWSPDGRFLMCNTLSPRLRVDNGIKIYHWSGELVHIETIVELNQVCFFLLNCRAKWLTVWGRPPGDLWMLQISPSNELYRLHRPLQLVYSSLLLRKPLGGSKATERPRHQSLVRQAHTGRQVSAIEKCPISSSEKMRVVPLIHLRKTELTETLSPECQRSRTAHQGGEEVELFRVQDRRLMGKGGVKVRDKMEGNCLVRRRERRITKLRQYKGWIISHWTVQLPKIVMQKRILQRQ